MNSVRSRATYLITSHASDWTDDAW